MQYPKDRVVRKTGSLMVAAMAISFFLSGLCSAQVAKVVEPAGPAVDAAKPSDEMEKRVQMLEAQLAVMQAELEKMKKALNEKAEPKAEPDAAAPSAGAAPAPSKPASESTATKQQQTQKQIGFDLGSVRVVPYGTIYFNAFTNTGAVNNLDVPMFARGDLFYLLNLVSTIEAEGPSR